MTLAWIHDVKDDIVNKPRRQIVYADRHLDCQFAMEDRFIEIMDDATTASSTGDGCQINFTCAQLNPAQGVVCDRPSV